jgi:hypothetical protein
VQAVKNLESAWVPVSVGIAVVLWFLATLLESRLQAPEQAPPPAGPVAEDSVEDFPAGEVVRAPLSCEVSEARLKRVIDRARSCEVDDDCTLFDYGYPLDCMTSVAKSQIPSLREEYRKYDESCEFRVFYDCPTDPYVRLSLCRNNRCIVELDRRDEELQDSTLEQMNRQWPDRK